MLKTRNFLNNLKLADITSVFFKKSFAQVNYGSVSGLPSILKAFERLTQKQISGYISSYLSPYLCGYRRIKF